MRFDYLVENPSRQTLDFVPSGDRAYGLVAAITSKRLPELLAETGLRDSFLAEYIAQLTIRQAVDRDLLTVEGQTMSDELRALYNNAPQVAAPQESGYLTELARPEDEALWRALGGHAGLKVLDRHGYTESPLGPFDIQDPATPLGSFVTPKPLYRPVAGRKDERQDIHYVYRHAVMRNAQGQAIYVSDREETATGQLNKWGEFVFYATID